MRSRYTAYALKNVDYILETQVDQDREAVERWAENAEFQELRIVRSDEDTVEFEADYRQDSQQHTHRELSHFEKRNGRWLFVKGHPPTRRASKVGRNDPCTCGSGKKYKKCCGV